MDHAFWQQRWEEGRIGWHRDEVSPHLPRYLSRFARGAPPRVLVPLCGKSHDLAYFASAGMEVVGIELVERAVREFFAEHGMDPRATSHDAMHRFTAGPITILRGDFFSVTREHVGPITAIFDRAALVALPPDLRRRYVPHLLGLVPAGVRLLLVTLAYDQSRVAGPPFSVPDEEVRAEFGSFCELEVLESAESGAVPGRFGDAGVHLVHETTWLLTKRAIESGSRAR